MDTPRKCLNIAYAIQNVGGIDFTRDVGDAVPVKYTLRGLGQAGHRVSCLMLRGRSVIGFDDISDSAKEWESPQGLAGTGPFRLLESGVRRLQRALSLPYFAFFDSYRFFEACLRCLPRYDLCHEHNGLFSVGTALACLCLRIPYVLTFSADPLLELNLSGKPLRSFHSLMAKWDAKLTFKLANKIICVSEPAKRHLVEHWQVDPGKITVMPNGVDVKLFGLKGDPQPARSRWGINREPLVTFVGGFQPWHGLDQLVEIFAQVLLELPAAKLLLVGDGPARPMVERKVAQLGLESSVLMTGILPHESIPEMLMISDVLTVPYPPLPKELWFSPLKLYESMAAGKAIVASKAGQIAEVIKTGLTGILVEPGDVEGFAQAVIELLKNPAERKRLGENARQQALRRHSWERYIERLIKIYWSVLGESSRKLST